MKSVRLRLRSQFIEDLVGGRWGYAGGTFLAFLAFLGFVLGRENQVLVLAISATAAVIVKILRQSYEYYQSCYSRPLIWLRNTSDEGLHHGRELYVFAGDWTLDKGTMLTLYNHGSQLEQPIAVLSVLYTSSEFHVVCQLVRQLAPNLGELIRYGAKLTALPVVNFENLVSPTVGGIASE
jgi:hypothetical protein